MNNNSVLKTIVEDFGGAITDASDGRLSYAFLIWKTGDPQSGVSVTVRKGAMVEGKAAIKEAFLSNCT